MNRWKFLALVAAIVLIFPGCQGKTVTCDGCGKDIVIEANSNMDDSWIIYCEDCELEFFGESGLVSPN